MNKLIAPLIQGVAHRPSTSPYKDELIQKFTSRALQGTRFQDTKALKAFEHSIAHKQYGVAINNLRSHEIPLNIDQYFPENGLGRVKNSVFYHMSRAFDSMLQQRLVELNQVQSRFLSSVVEQSRISLERQNEKQMDNNDDMKTQLTKVGTILEGQRHDPELLYVYIFLSINLGIQVIGFFAIQFLKTRIANWILMNNQQGLLMGVGTSTRTYMDNPAPEPPCCSPLMESQRPVGASRQDFETDMSPVCRACPGINSPHSIGERCKRHPVTYL